MTARRRLLVPALALAFVLAACGAPTDPGPPAPTTITGSVATEGSAVFGAGLVLFDPSAVGIADVAPASVVDAGFGTYFGPVSPVDDDGFTIVLPDAAELPTEVRSFAGEALYNIDGVADCEVVADVPTALLTSFAVGYGALPGAYAVSVEGGFMLGLVSDDLIDFAAADLEAELGGKTLYAWLHASEAVSLSIEGAGCAAATNIGVTGGVDLEAGWNQVAWDLNADFTLATLRDDDGSADLVMNVPETF